MRSEECIVRSGGRGAQLIKRPNTPFYRNMLNSRKSRPPLGEGGIKGG